MTDEFGRYSVLHPSSHTGHTFYLSARDVQGYTSRAIPARDDSDPVTLVLQRPVLLVVYPVREDTGQAVARSEGIVTALANGIELRAHESLDGEGYGFYSPRDVAVELGFDSPRYTPFADQVLFTRTSGLFVVASEPSVDVDLPLFERRDWLPTETAKLKVRLTGPGVDTRHPKLLSIQCGSYRQTRFVSESTAEYDLVPHEWATLSCWSPDRTGGRSSVVLGAPGSTTEVKIRLASPGVIRLHCRLPEATPLGDIEIGWAQIEPQVGYHGPSDPLEQLPTATAVSFSATTELDGLGWGTHRITALMVGPTGLAYRGEACVAVAESSVDVDLNLQPNGNGVLSGVVVDDRDRGVGGAFIRCRDALGRELSCESDLDGRFRLFAPMRKPCGIRAFKDNRSSDNVVGHAPQRSISLRLRDMATVEVHVEAESGLLALETLLVEATPTSRYGFRQSFSLDDSGSFGSSLPAGTYEIHVADGLGRESNKSVQLEWGEDRRVDMPLPVAPAFEVQVVDCSKRPIDDVVVYRGKAFVGRSDEFGRISIPGGADCVLAAECPGCPVSLLRWDVRGGAAPRWVLPDAVSFAGELSWLRDLRRVRCRGPAFYAELVWDSGNSRVPIDGLGRFRFDDVVTGRARLLVDVSAGHTAVLDVDVPSSAPAVLRYGEGRVTVTGAQSSASMQLRVQPQRQECHVIVGTRTGEFEGVPVGSGVLEVIEPSMDLNGYFAPASIVTIGAEQRLAVDFAKTGRIDVRFGIHVESDARLDIVPGDLDLPAVGLVGGVLIGDRSRFLAAATSGRWRVSVAKSVCAGDNLEHRALPVLDARVIDVSPGKTVLVTFE